MFEQQKVNDLSSWYTRAEVCKILQMSPRWLNERLADGVLVIERRKRDRKGFGTLSNQRNKFEPCYNPVDVDRIAAEKAPKPTVLEPAVDVKQSREDLIGILLKHVMAILEHRQATLDRGPWLRVKDAARETGLRPIVIRRVANRMMTDRHQDVFRDGKVLKIRKAALGELRAQDLHTENPALNDGPRHGIAIPQRPALSRGAAAGAGLYMSPRQQ